MMWPGHHDVECELDALGDACLCEYRFHRVNNEHDWWEAVRQARKHLELCRREEHEASLHERLRYAIDEIESAFREIVVLCWGGSGG